MRVGTPGFSGARLREAREARAQTVVSLTELAGVTAQAIYSYENDRSSPSPDVLTRLSNALNMPLAFFLLPARADDSTVFYRSLSAATKAARRKADHRVAWLRDIVEYLTEFVVLPTPNFPSLDLPMDPLLLSDDEIEEAAEQVRRYWQLGNGPIANMVLLLENQGAVIARDKLGAETLDGISRLNQGHRPYIIIGTDKGAAARWRFDTAHELGHIILHSHLSREAATRADHHKRLEQQAHRFAAAFLLPLSTFGEELYAANLDVLRTLKQRWNVSIAMMLMRARHGGLMSEDTARRMWITMSRRKWRTVEPYDDTTEPESPRLLARSFELILEQGAQTPADVVSRLALPASDIEALCGLSAGFLSDYAPVALLGTSRERMSPVRPTDGDARIIQLPKRRDA